MPPSIRFCRTADGASIAYAIGGDGPPLLLPSWWVSHVERNWEEPEFRAFMTALAREHTVVRYDRPGVGLSDRRRTRYTLEEDAAAFAALADHLGYERFSLLGISCGGPLAIDYAARNPERVARIVVYGGFAHGQAVGTEELKRAMVGLVRAHWGVGARTLTDVFAPELSTDAAKRFAEQLRASADTETAACLLDLTYRMDVLAAAAAIRAPTLVLHPRYDRAIGLGCGRDLAARIGGATFAVVESRAHLPWHGGAAATAEAILAFLRGHGPRAVPADDGGAELQRSGEIWSLSFRGRRAHVRHARGLSDLAVLLARPGEEVHVLELAGGAGIAPPRLGADAVLDAKARDAYRERIADLDAELDEATAAADVARAERLAAEREAILDALKVATGLGGRARALNDPAERARKAVTARLRDAIARIRAAHPELGRHLEESIATGTFCSYGPPEPVSWRTSTG